MIRRLLRASPLGRIVEERRRRAEIAASPWFAADHYRAACAAAGVDLGGTPPLDHFVRRGQALGIDPHPDFDTDAYVTANPDGAGAALTHFLRATAGTDLSPGQVFDRRVTASGWIDAEWYGARYGTDDPRIHPYVDYLRTGAALGRSPGPLFDAEEYLAAHGLPPGDALAHWLAEQRAPGPVASTLPARDRGPRPIGRHRVRPRDELAHRDVCVMIHAFYPDALPGLLEHLRALPRPATLLVSVVDEPAAGAAVEAIDAVLGPDWPRVVKVVPNRGRNFAPLLCWFPDEIARHEFVLHLHTKKSLHTGSEAVDWRGHLLRHLVGSEAVVDSILSRFVDDPLTGVIQPPMFDGLPQWASHWLGNSGRGRQLLERLGLDPALGGGFVDYPVGGMFWARTSALAPLFGLAIGVDHFEEEAGQTDRTLAHTIERLIGFSAIAAGQRLVEFDAGSGMWRVGWSSRGIDRFGAAGRAEIADAVGRADLVSLDLFDTLLLRPSLDPEALRVDAARRSVEDGEDLLRRRIEAEVRARTADPTVADSTMTEIYAEAVAADPGDAERFAALRDAEVELERVCAVARRWLIEELRTCKRPGVRYVLMTDTYLERPVIDELLDLIGAADLFDEVYVSNEVRARKDSGSMWDLVAEREGCPVGRWLHLGDNLFADVQQAADRGIASIHLPSPGDVAGVGGFHPGRYPADTRDLTAVVAGAGVAALLADRPVRDERTPEEFGYGVVGPITFAFVRWLLDRAGEDGVDHLLFVARDGWLSYRFLDACREVLPAGVPPTGYLPTSRRAAMRLSRTPGAGIADVLDAGGFRGTIGDLLLARLGHRMADTELAERQVVLPADRDEVIAALTAELPVIERLGERDRPAFDRYLADLGVGPGDRVGLVDLGFSATTQRVLAGVLDQPLLGYYAVTTAKGSATDGVRSCFAEDVEWDDGILLHTSQRVFEVVWSAADGQVDHLTETDGGVVVVTDDRTRRDERTTEIAAQVQSAALRYVEDLVARHGRALFERPFDPRGVAEAITRALDTLVPSPDLVFEDLHLDDHFSGIPRLTVVVERTPEV
jgi:FMN phosphatase YigB (HAD superfamily)